MKLVFLSTAFYEKYANCSEILTKPTRPYVCLEIRINNITFAIPLRHNIKHKHAFFTGNKSGLDYTKAVVISSQQYISANIPQIEQKTFNAIKGRDAIIKSGLERYIREYKRALKYKGNPNYENIRRCSALQYFERYL